MIKTNFKRLTMAFLAVLISTMVWGQEPKTDPINLSTCTITVNNNRPYGYTGENITVNNKDVVVTTNTSIIIPQSEYEIAASAPINEKGHYTLTVTAKEGSENYTGSKIRKFYVLAKTDDDYTISSVEDWDLFASCVEDGYNFNGLTVKLTANIGTNENPITTMVGYAGGYGYTPFSGTFDGNGKTLHVSYSEDYYNAPFYYTDGATIKNLTVTGSVETTGGYSAGLIYSNDKSYIDRTTTVQDVTVSVNITDGNNDSAGEYCGGFSVYSSFLVFNNCVYNGKIIAGDNSGGFCGEYETTGGSTFNNCFFNPADGSSISDGENFGVGNVNSANCYYTMPVGTSTQGTRLYKKYSDAPEDIIVKPFTTHGANVFKEVEVIPEIEEAYIFNSETPVNYYLTVIGSTVKFDGTTVSTTTDYTPTVKYGAEIVEEVTSSGEYKFIITGKGNYHGSFSKTFYVAGSLSGSGTEGVPFIIANAGDWYRFAYEVNNGNTYSGQYLKLDEDITVSTMVGTPDNRFSGTFTGRVDELSNDLHTLTFNFGTNASPTEEEIIAPFRYTNGATIKYLKIAGSIHTNKGKEAGLIGVNTGSTSVSMVIVTMDFYCYESLWDAEGGGFAYDGTGVAFNSCAYQGYISASNYHGGICGDGDNTTTFTNCLFNPKDGGLYWAENFIYNKSGNTPSNYYETCYYTLGNNQESSEQGTRVYVGEVSTGSIGKELTKLYGVTVYVPVTVVIGGFANTYIFDNDNPTAVLLNVGSVTVTYNGDINAVENNYCTVTIKNSKNVTVTDVVNKDTYTLTVAGRDAGTNHVYAGSIIKTIRVVEGSSEGWAELQTLFSGSTNPINITKDYEAGVNDVALTIDRDVTINLNGHTISRNRTDNDYVSGGHVIKIGVGAHVTINGGGTITGGRNQAPTNTEHGENCDGGGIYNKGTLILNGNIGSKTDNVIYITNNKCVKSDLINPGMYRTARGGGIYSAPGSTLTIRGCVIRDNESQGGGGGIYSEKAIFTMSDNSVVRSNKSLDKGGGLRVDAHNVSVNVTDSEISSNTVEYHNAQSASNGGGIHLDDGTLNLTDCVIKNNNSSKYGGGIYILKGTVNAKDCSVLYNQSYDASDKFEGYGGGVCIMGGAYNMDGGSVVENSSYIEKGGGIFVNAGKTLRIKGVVNISGNWKYDDASLENKSNTNVHLMGSNDCININGSIAGSFISVSKTGEGVFTNGLSGYGNIANFSSDEEEYHIFPIGGEAKLGKPSNIDPGSAVNKVLNITSATVLKTTIADGTIDQITFSGDGCLHVDEGGYIKADIVNPTDPNVLVIENGGQVFLPNTSTNVKVTMKKDIEAAMVLSQQNWYILSSCINNPTGSETVVYNPISITGNTNLIKLSGNDFPEYDLYRFNEAVALQWENYRAEDNEHNPLHDDFTTLEHGRGYLYRNANDYTVNMVGTLNVGSIDYTLSYTSTVDEKDNPFKGFNMIGNPYSHNIYKGAAGSAIPNGDILEAKYYVLDANDGSWDITNDGTAIPPMTGILVQAKAAGTLTMANSMEGYVAPSKGNADNNNIWFAVANSKYKDKACVEFRKGHGLNKIAHINEEAPMLYINHNGEDFASADVNPEAKVINLNFEAKTMGMFTLSCKANGEFNYLHVFDKVAGRDIDMLNDDEYTFIGSPGDSKDRFVVRLSETTTDDNGNEIFAYQNGSDIIINGEGELQVFDVMGRMISNQHINGVQMVEKPSQTGVYIFRLNDKTQKIVVR